MQGQAKERFVAACAGLRWANSVGPTGAQPANAATEFVPADAKSLALRAELQTRLALQPEARRLSWRGGIVLQPGTMQPYFEPVSRDASCAYCTGRRHSARLPESIDAVYCISLQEQPQRTREAVAHFHRVGLCRHVIFYRPIRGENGERAIWESHRAIARHALAKGCRSALMLEDDVLFRQPWDRLAPRIARAMDCLPANWWCFYVGHVPIQGFFIRPNILRVRSACTHAYIASPRLLSWLADTEPLSEEVATWPRIGRSIDGAMANLPAMYALFPMAALQRFLGDYRVDTRVDGQGLPRRWSDGDRWRYYFIFRGALVTEMLAAMLSPLHWFTLERNRKRTSGAPARSDASTCIDASNARAPLS